MSDHDRADDLTITRTANGRVLLASIPTRTGQAVIATAPYSPTAAETLRRVALATVKDLPELCENSTMKNFHGFVLSRRHDRTRWHLPHLFANSNGMGVGWGTTSLVLSRAARQSGAGRGQVIQREAQPHCEAPTPEVA